MLRRKKRRKLDVSKHHKFCPVCGRKLETQDTFCTRCGYSFAQRKNLNKNPKVKWRNLIIVVVILILIYLGIRLLNGEPILPSYLSDLLNSSRT